jgi:hypothetical protein
MLYLNFKIYNNEGNINLIREMENEIQKNKQYSIQK